MVAAFVLDGNREIGLGHLSRCLEIMKQLKVKDCCGKFYFITPSDIVKNELTSKGLNVIKTPDFENSEYNKLLIDTIRRNEIDSIIFDLLEKQLKLHLFLINLEKVALVSIASFNYTFDRFEDISIYPDFEIEEEKFITGIKHKQIKLIRGPKYLTIREEFCLGIKKPINENANKILITMGGADPEKLTIRAIESIEQINLDLVCNVLVGKANPNISLIEKIVSTGKHTYFVHHHVDEMAKMMQCNDIAIINGGITRYEMAAAGLPFIAIAIHDLQYSITETITKHGAGINLGIGSKLNNTDIASAIEQLLLDKNRRQQIRDNMMKLVDCKGASRIADTVIDLYNSKIAY